ncbi:MAG: RecX family transcriptional regulator [bacterium]
MKITKIMRQKYRRRYYSVFIDAKFSFHIDLGLLSDSGIKEGESISKKRLDEIVCSQRRKEAQDYAYLLLSYRDRSKKEIKARLKRKKYPESVISEVLYKLENEGYINDYIYASSWIKSRLREKPRGRKLLFLELIQKGIHRETIDKALGEHFPDSFDEAELAKRALEKKLPSYKKLDEKTAKRRIQSFLLRRGFSYDAIREICDEELE